MAASEKTALEQDWILLREKAVAWLRVAFAAVAIAVIYLNPSRAARFPLLSIDALGSFFLYSTIALYFVNKTPFGTSRVGAITTALDVFWIAVIVYSTGGTSTPFFFYYSFPVITASVRWGIKGSVPVALVGVSAYVIMRVTLSGEAGTDPIGIDNIVVRSFYLFVLAGIFGYISEFEKKQNKTLLALSHTAGQVAALQERRRIMYELHDGILQSLATLILRLEACRSRTLRSDSELDRELRDIEDLTRSSMKEIRQFLAGKDTQPLVHGTLAERVRDELQFLRDGLGVRAILETEPEELNLAPLIEREVYYVIREGLTNITRHSHAARAEVHLHQFEKTLEGMLVDDGVGMNLENPQDVLGVGLKSMKDRIGKLGGELEINSSPGSGTRITFSLPLSPSRQAVANN
jgi:two-component system, NarL family, sensor histidine kinase DegS